LRQEEEVKELHEKIYEEARRYLDTRQNDTHISLSLEFACRLLTHYPDADADVVIPAVLLHDVGWKMVPEERQRGAFGPTVRDKETQRFHETEGVRIAGEILRRVMLDGERAVEILAIIDGHDTRLEALSLNDALVKDADKLWRFTPTGVDIDYVRFGYPRDTYVDYLATVIDTWLFTSEGRAMARKALDDARVMAHDPSCGTDPEY
jgi:hypothetical protein